VALAACNVAFYEALDRIPLGIATTVEFLGPLAIATFGSRRAADLVWVAVAGVGVALLGNPTLHVNVAGLVLALVAGAFWAAYILLSKRLVHEVGPVFAITAAFVVSAVVLTPFAVGRVGSTIFRPSIFGTALAVAALSAGLPYFLELVSLRLVSASTFSIFLSLEPAAAALMGLAILGQHLALVELLAVLLVVSASAGASMSARSAVGSILPAPDPGGEIVDLVDGKDEVIGRTPRHEVRERNLLHREVTAIVRNHKGEIYVHRRTDTKDVFPGMYDMFVAGVVASGESYGEAIRRELKEELDIHGVDPAFMFKARYRDPAVNWWACTYEVVWDGPIHHQEEEIAWGGFMSEADLVANLDRWAFVPDGLRVFRRYLDERDR
jgi:inner membrane transporter RhtA